MCDVSLQALCGSGRTGAEWSESAAVSRRGPPADHLAERGGWLRQGAAGNHLLGRVAAAADIYVALTTDRTDRCVFSGKDAATELRRLASQGADRLYISAKTADHHIQPLYTKIGVSTRAAAALWAMQHALADRAIRDRNGTEGLAGIPSGRLSPAAESGRRLSSGDYRSGVLLRPGPLTGVPHCGRVVSVGHRVTREQPWR
jgi:hypothetical protein